MVYVAKNGGVFYLGIWESAGSNFKLVNKIRVTAASAGIMVSIVGFDLIYKAPRGELSPRHYRHVPRAPTYRGTPHLTNRKAYHCAKKGKKK